MNNPIYVKAAIYRTNIVNGVEEAPRRMTLSGKELSGPMEMTFARTGEFPNYSRRVEYREAVRQLSFDWGACLASRLKNFGPYLRLVSRKECHKRAVVESGTILLEEVYDLYRETPENATRFRIVYTKVD